MKRYLIMLSMLILSVLTSFAQQQTPAFSWATGTPTFQPSASTLRLNGVAFASSQNGVIVGSDGKVYRTTNGVSSWIAIANPVASLPGGSWGRPEFYDVAFIGQNSYIAVASAGKVMKSTNGGESWDTITITPQPTINNYKSVASHNGIVLIGGEAGKLFRSTNYGQNWNQVNDSDFGSLTFNDISIVDNSTMYIAGSVGRIFKSTDGGLTWAVQIPEEINVDGFNAIAFKNATHGIAVGERGKVYITNNGGSSWTRVQNVFPSNIAFDAVLYKENTVIIAGQQGNVWSSNNNGVSWVSNNRQGYTGRFKDLTFTSNNTAFVVGFQGIAYKIENITYQEGGNNNEEPAPAAPTFTWTNSNTGMLPAQNDAINGREPALLSTYFISSQVGFAGGGAGRLYKTTNAGASWVPVQYTGFSSTNSVASINDVYFKDLEEGYAVLSDGRILKTIDGGIQWSTLQVTNQDGTNNGIQHNTAITIGDKVLIAGLYGKAFTSENGGPFTYNSIQQNVTLDINGSCKIGTNVYLCGENGRIVKSTDGNANTWVNSRNGITDQVDDMYDIHFISETKGYVVGQYGAHYKTTNGGDTWETFPLSNVRGTIKAIDFRGNNGVIVGADGKAWVTTNGGASWNYSKPDPNATYFLYDVKFISNNVAIVVGDEQKIYKLVIGNVAEEPNLTAIPANVIFQSEATAIEPLTETVEVTANVNWVVDESIEWLNVDPTSGNTNAQLTFTAQQNRTTNQRSGTVRVRNADNSIVREITVTQAAGSGTAPVVTLEVTPASFNFAASAGILPVQNGSVTVTSNSAWTATESLDWVVIQSANGNGNGNFVFTVINNTGAQRSGVITVTAGNVTREVAITQAAGSVAPPPTPPAGNGSWVVVPSGTNNTLNDIHLHSPNLYYAVGADGKIIKSVTKGLTWTNVTNNVANNQSLSSVFFTSPEVGYVGGILRTISKTNGNENIWTTQEVGSGRYGSINDIYFKDAQNGYACGAWGNYLKTNDYGATWTRVNLPNGSTGNYENNLTKIKFSSSQVGLMTGYLGAIFRTEDGGATWSKMQSPAGSQYIQLRGLDINSQGVAIVVGNAGCVLRSADGIQWTRIQGQAIPTTLGTKHVISVAFANDNLVFAGCQGGYLMKSDDAGLTWQEIQSGTNKDIQEIDFDSEGTGIAVCKDGVILRYGTAAITPPVPTEYTWTAQTVQNIGTNSLYGLSRIDAMNAYAVGTNKTIIKTVDGGINWTPVENNVTPGTGINAVHFISNDVGYIAAPGAKIAKTTDYGATWSTGRVGTGTWRDVYFTNATTGYACGTSAQVAKTINGTGWEVETVSSYGGTFMAQKVLNNGNIIAVGSSGGIYKKSNNDWGRLPAGLGTASITFKDVDFKDNNVGIVVGDGGFILRTTGGGDQWTRIQGASVPQSLGNKSLKAVCFADANTVYIGGADGYMLKSTNAGATWSEVTSGTDKTINNIAFYSDGTGIAVCEGATVLRYGPATITPPTAMLLVAPQEVNFDASAVSGTQTRSVAVTANNNWTVSIPAGDASWLRAEPAQGTAENTLLTLRANNNDGNAARTSTVTVTAGGISREITVNQAADLATPASVTWTRHTNVPAPAGTTGRATLFAVATPASDKALVGGQYGNVYKTDNTGTDWIKLEATANPYTGTIQAMAFADSQKGYAVGNNGKVMKTTNGGAGWSMVTPDPAVKTLWAVATKGSIVLASGYNAGENNDGFNMRRSENNGADWSKFTVPAIGTTGITDIQFVTDSLVFASGEEKVFKSYDAGKTWTNVSTGIDLSSQDPRYRKLQDIYFIDALNGYVVGNLNTAYKTTDGGAIWTQVNQFNVPGQGRLDLQSISFFGKTGIITGSESAAWTTTDGGETWAFQKTDNTSDWDVNDVAFYDYKTAVAAGHDTRIYKATFSRVIAPPTLTVSSENVRLFGTQLTQAITVESNADWTVADDADWMRVIKNPLNNNELVISLIPNLNITEDKIGTVVVTANNGRNIAVKNITVTMPVPTVLTVNPKTVNFAAASSTALPQSETITVASNKSWTVSVPQTANWLTVNPATGTAGTFTITAENNTSAERTADITVTAGTGDNTKTETIRVTQAGTIVTPSVTWTRITEGIERETGPGVNSQPALQTVSAPTDMVAYAAGTRGKLFKTVTGGTSWTEFRNNPIANMAQTAEIRSLYFTDAQTGYVVGYNGNVMRTVDGGANWIVVNPAPSPRMLWAVGAYGNTIVTSGYNDNYQTTGNMRRSTNGGATWNNISSSAIENHDITDIHFVNSTLAFACGDYGKIFKSVDGGATWYLSNNGVSIGRKFEDIYFKDAMNGYVVGARSTAYKTIDGGLNWEQVPQFRVNGGNRDLKGVCLNGDAGVIVGGAGCTWTTTDGGTTWNYYKPDESFTLSFNKVDFFDYNTAVVVGHDLRVYIAEFSGLTPPNPPAPTPTLTVNPRTVNFAATAVNPALPLYKIVEVEANNPWTVTIPAEATWLTAAPMNGNNTVDETITLTAQPNSGDARTTTVTVTSGGVERTITVTQAAGTTAPTLTVNPTAIEFEQFADGNSFDIRSNTAWEISTDAGWLTITPMSGNGNRSIDVQTEENTGAQRTATITVTDGNEVKRVTVTQAGVSTLTPGWNVVSTNAQGTGAYSDIYKQIKFKSATEGIIAGNGGMIARTNDGISWNESNLSLSNYEGVYGIYYQGNTIKLATNHSKVKVSTNNGPWETIGANNDPNYFDDIYFIDENTLIGGGYAYNVTTPVMRSTTGGASWINIPTTGRGGVRDIDFVNSQTGWFVGFSSTLFKTTDGGETWMDQDPGFNYNLDQGNPANAEIGGLSGVDFLTDQIGYVCGYDGRILKTINGGATWYTKIVDQNEDYLAIYAINENLVYVVGRGGVIRKTVDGGLNWTLETSNTTKDLHGVYFTDANNGYAVGADRTIVRFYQPDPTLTVSQSKVQFNATATGTAVLSKVIEVESNSDWTVTVPSTDNWISVRPAQGTGDGGFTISVTDNNGAEERNGSVTVTAGLGAGAISKTIKVKQISRLNTPNVWTQLTTGIADNTKDLNKIFFVNDSVGFFVGDPGVGVRKTTDKGATWNNIAGNYGRINNNVGYSVFFLDENNGYVGLQGQLMQQTFNSGADWDSPNGSQMNVNDMDFISVNYGRFVSLNLGYIYFKRDGARRFAGENLGNDVTGVRAIHVPVESVGYAIGHTNSADVIIKAVDYLDEQEGWNVRRGYTFPLNSMNDIYFINATTGFIVGNNGVIKKTNNRAESWQDVTSGTSNNLKSIHFVTSEVGYICGDGGLILRTDDGGATWNQEESGVTTNLRSIHSASPSFIYVCGEDNTVLRKHVSNAIIPTLVVTPLEHEFSPNTELSKEITVESNFDWTVSVPSAAEDWIFVQPAQGTGDGTFTITATENTTPINREAIVTVRAGSISKQIRIHQNRAIEQIADGWTVRKFDGDASSTNLNHSFTHVAFKNATHGFASGPNKKLAKTTDGGITWEYVDFPENNILFYGLSYTENALRLGTNTHILYKNINDGTGDWSAKVSNERPNGFSDQIYFVDNDLVISSIWGGFPGSGNHKVLRSTDGGDSWNTIPTNGFAEVLKFDFINSNIGWGVGYKGTVVKTINGGQSWEEQATPLPRNTTNDLVSCLMGVDFVDENVGYAAGYDGKILKTINGGTTWDTLSSGTIRHLYDIKAFNADLVLAVGQRGTILRSNDGGASWVLEASNTTEDLQEVTFIDYKNAVAVGNKRTIVRYRTRENNVLNINPMEVRLANQGGSTSIINVEANKPWTSTASDWIELNLVAGLGNATVEVKARTLNGTPTQREGFVTFYLGNIQKRVKVIQEAGVSTISISKNSETVQSSGGIINVDVTSNDNWIVEDNVNWAYATPEFGAQNGTVNITVVPNTTEEIRTAKFTFKTINNVSETMTITQGAAGTKLVVDKNIIQASSATSTHPVHITSNLEWTATPSVNWITVVPRNGTGNAVINIIVNENSSTDVREGKVTVAGGGVVKEIAVYQNGKAAQVDWVVVPNTVDNDFTSVMMPSQNTAYITGWSIYQGTSGEPAKVVKTTDYGATWSNFTPDMAMTGGFGFNTIYFTDNNNGHIAGFSAKYGKTQTAGEGWSVKAVEGPTYQQWGNAYYSVDFPTNDVGYMVGVDWTIYKTTDAGETWTRKYDSQGSGVLRCVDFVNAQLGYAVGDKKTILKTVDGGDNWTTLSNDQEGSVLHGVHFINENIGYVVGYEGTYGKTDDGGRTWTWTNGLNGYDNLYLYSVKFVTPDKGYIVGGNGKIFKTENAGQFWEEEQSVTANTLMSVSFYDEDHGFAVGKKGTILKYVPGGANLSVSPTTVSAPASGKRQSITVTSNGYWTVESKETWIKTDVANGNNDGNVNLTIDPNPTIETRVGTVIFKLGNIETAVVVTQNPLEPQITIIPNTALISLGAIKGRTQTIKVKSNVKWEVRDIEKEGDWITITPMKGNSGETEVTITANQNDNTEARSATFKIGAGKTEKKITVTQNGVETSDIVLKVNPKEVIFEYIKASQAVQVTSNQEWIVERTAEWITINKDKGKNDGNIVVSVDANESIFDRVGMLIFKTKNNTKFESVLVTQKGKHTGVYFEVTPEYITLEAANNSNANITVTTNQAWTASEDADWLSLSKEYGNGDAKISVVARENTATEERTATVTLKSGEITKTVVVTQLAAEMVLTVNPETLEFTHEKGSKEVSIESNTKWKLSTESKWITFTQNEGNGNSNFNVEVEENTANEERTGTVKVAYANGKEKVINVKQAGAPSSVEVASDDAFIYPNPTEEVLFIKHANTIKSVKVIDARGKAVINIDKLSVNSIYMKDLTAGTYTVVIVDAQGNTISKKITKL